MTLPVHVLVVDLDLLFVRKSGQLAGLYLLLRLEDTRNELEKVLEAALTV
jgi:hypothetical protein